MPPEAALGFVDPRTGRPGSGATRRQLNAAVPSLRRRLGRTLYRLLLRAALGMHAVWVVLGRKLRPVRSQRAPDGVDLLLTAMFHSESWIRAQLEPLARAPNCRTIWLITTTRLPPLPKLHPVYPPRWLIRCTGRSTARLIVFAWTAVRRRPHIIGGFHLLVNGLVADALASWLGVRSLYISTGGPMEAIDGGIWAENRLFAKIETPAPVIERRLFQAVGRFSQVVVRGSRAREVFRSRGAFNPIEVITGGIDGVTFAPPLTPPDIDLIFTGRLAEIKRIDVFLRTVRLVRDAVPSVSAIIVGDGERRTALEALARELDIGDCITFAGHQADVAGWLRRSKIFVLTSDSEGLALSLMEAMMCGLPAVVSDVGDLGDLVEDGVNGYLVQRRSPEAFAERICELLLNEDKLAANSRAARQAALRHETGRVARRWDEILEQEASRPR